MLIGGLFEGYGGLTTAVRSVLGGEPAWFCENDLGAAAVLAHNAPGVPNLGDITRVDWATVPRVDVLAGGPPCQDLSLAGAGAGLRHGTRSGLWFHMADAIAALRPRLVVIENVRGLLSREADSEMEPCPWCLGDGADVPALRALEPYSATWPASGTTRGGVAYVHPTSEHRTSGSGSSSLLPTPTAADSDRSSATYVRGNPTLVGALLPTPTASDAYGPGPHGTGSADLRTTVRMLPTPTARDGKGPNQRGDATCLHGALLSGGEPTNPPSAAGKRS